MDAAVIVAKAFALLAEVVGEELALSFVDSATQPYRHTAPVNSRVEIVIEGAVEERLSPTIGDIGVD